ncbi:MAG: four helix bundle protein [Chloroflexota bacterium]|nr:four helix bundle protein [Chloroflexota bacterium]
MQGFRELRVWQGALKQAVEVYRITATFPRHETYGLSTQIQRAPVSVAANIAEGKSRDHLGDYLRFVSIARGSLGEVETYVELAARLHYVGPEKAEPLFARCAAIGRQLHKLRSSLAASRNREGGST